MKNATIQQEPATFSVEIDGKIIRGKWEVTGEWEGMMKLECQAPTMWIIIEKPAPLPNIYSVAHPIFGGNKIQAQALPVTQATIIKHSGFKL